jgi:hypothetical protein
MMYWTGSFFFFFVYNFNFIYIYIFRKKNNYIQPKLCLAKIAFLRKINLNVNFSNLSDIVSYILNSNSYSETN